MRGRTPAGPEYVQRLQGSDIAKQRLETLLETIKGNCRVAEACERLGICEQRFHQLRHQMLEAALAGVEPRAPGRPPQTTDPLSDEVRRLREQNAALELELRTVRAREEIALTLPRVAPTLDDAEKKTTRRRGRPPRSPHGKKKNT